VNLALGDVQVDTPKGLHHIHTPTPRTVAPVRPIEAPNANCRSGALGPTLHDSAGAGSTPSFSGRADPRS
jgi:hypothetical protein